MSAPPYMKLYVADYHGDTTHLGALEHGAYLLLLMAMWRAGGKLPGDDVRLAKLAKVTPDQWAEIKPTILDFFRRRGGTITHKRIAEEMAKYETVSVKRKAASEKGVAEKRRKNNEKAQPNGSDRDNHLVTKPEPEPEEREEPPKPPEGAPTSNPIRLRKADVEAVWSITPRESRERSSRQDVERALIAAARRGHDPAEILRGLAGYFASEQATKDGGAFVKGVHRMIERDRWQVFAEAPAPLLDAAEAPKPGDVWARRIHAYRQNAYWNRLDWGPPPGKPGCTIPDEVLMTAGYLPTPITKEVAA